MAQQYSNSELLAQIDNLKVKVALLVSSTTRLERELAATKLLSIIDEKTGLYNDRHFKQSLVDEYERLRRGLYNVLSMIVIDLDNFKQINDTHGHVVGDVILKLVADAVRETVRSIDTACRYGGEELVIILPGTDAKGAYALAERLRTAIAEKSVKSKDSLVRVTASLGVSTHQDVAGSNNESVLFRAADDAMYAAKHGGRNRTCVAKAA